MPENASHLQYINTAAVSDALDSMSLTGHLAGIAARVPGAVAIGPAYTVRYRPTSNDSRFKNAANYIDDVPAGSVIVVDNAGTSACTTWGEILTAAAQQRELAATVIFGAARDLSEIQKAQYPLFSTALSMVSGKNRVELAATGEPIIIGGVVVNAGDIVVADDCGVLAIPQVHAAEVLHRAHNVDATERQILQAVRLGHRLDEARRRFDYSQPWLEQGRASN